MFRGEAKTQPMSPEQFAKISQSGPVSPDAEKIISRLDANHTAFYDLAYQTGMQGAWSLAREFEGFSLHARAEFGVSEVTIDEEESLAVFTRDPIDFDELTVTGVSERLNFLITTYSGRQEAVAPLSYTERQSRRAAKREKYKQYNKSLVGVSLKGSDDIYS